MTRQLMGSMLARFALSIFFCAATINGTLGQVTSTTVLWSDALAEEGIGNGNIPIVDNQGTTEILVASGDFYKNACWWRVLTFDPYKATYTPVFASEYFTGSLRRIVVGDVTGDSGKEIVVILASGQVHVYDLRTKAKLTSFATVNGPYGLVLSDVEGTGKDQLILCTTAATYVYSGAGALQWSTPSTGGYDVAVGQMDDDPALEIAVTNGYVIDAATRAVQWNRGSSFGMHVECGDIDGDGKAELLGANNILTAFDVDTNATKWTYTMHGYNQAGSLRVENIDSDPDLEIVTGVDLFGSTYALNSITRTKEWEIAPARDGITEIGIGDADGDGMNEIFWGAGAGDTAKDVLYGYSFSNNTMEYTSTHVDAPVIGPEVGDLDGDGYDEVVIASFEGDSGYDSGRILVYDALTHKLRAVSGPVARIYGTWGSSYEGTQDITLHDLDGDGKKEILIATDEGYDGLIEAYRLNANDTVTAVWHNTVLAPNYDFSSVTVGDVDNDGNLEVVGGTSLYGYVYVYDYSTSATEWVASAASGGNPLFKTRIANVDGDAVKEIVTANTNGSISIIDGASHTMQNTISGNFTDFDIRDGVIFASTNFGYFETYAFSAPNSFPRTSQVRPVTSRIDGFTLETTSPLAMWMWNGGAMKYYAGGAIQSVSAPYGTPLLSRYRNGFFNGYTHLAANKLASPEITVEPATTDATSNTISWRSVYSANDYLVQAASDANFTNVVADSGWITGLEHQFNLWGGQFYFRVKARQSLTGAESLWSRVVTTFQVPVTVSGFSIE